jgi:hypothetical protein
MAKKQHKITLEFNKEHLSKYFFIGFVVVVFILVAYSDNQDKQYKSLNQKEINLYELTDRLSGQKPTTNPSSNLKPILKMDTCSKDKYGIGRIYGTIKNQQSMPIKRVHVTGTIKKNDKIVGVETDYFSEIGAYEERIINIAFLGEIPFDSCAFGTTEYH